MTDVHDVEERGEEWIATVRPEHEFDDVDAMFVRSPALEEIAQGAEVRRGTLSDGSALVYQVRLPNAPGRSRENVETLANAVARRVD